MSVLRLGMIGAGYMGRAHTIAYQAVGTLFEPAITPVLEMICTTTAEGAADYARRWGWNRATADWRALVNDPSVDAVLIATPPRSHHDIALAALALGKPVFCEKPLGCSAAESRAMVEAAEASGVVNMVGFNYIRTPASQLAQQIIASGELGEILQISAEHVEDYLHPADSPASWRTREATATRAGALGDVAAHIINACLRLVGPIESLVADTQIVRPQRPGPHGMERVENDDQGQMLLRFANGAGGSLVFSRVAAGRKMGYTYRVTGSRGALAFDQENQNELWLYDAVRPRERQGFQRLLMGPGHPDYLAFNMGPGHGTGYNEQIAIEARDFLQAVHEGQARWPSFRDGYEVDRVIEAALVSADERRWVALDDVR